MNPCLFRHTVPAKPCSQFVLVTIQGICGHEIDPFQQCLKNENYENSYVIVSIKVHFEN